MIEHEEIIKIRKKRDKDESLFCEKCEHTGRFYFIDKDKQVNHRYCECYLKSYNQKNYPILLKRSKIPSIAWKFNLNDYSNTGITKEEVDKNNQTIEKIRKICVDIVNFCDSGNNCFVQGQKGTGKTIMACLIARYAMINGRATAYTELTTAASILLREMNDEDRNWIEYIRWCKFLVIDNIDLFQTKGNLQESIFDQIVRPRIQNNLSCCFVSTIPFKLIGEKIGQNNASLIHERCELLSLVGKDFRSQ